MLDSKLTFDESNFLTDITPKIANIIDLESKLLRNLKLDTQFSSGTPTLNSEKLDRLTALSRTMFSDITYVSDKLHEVTKDLNPSYTRLSSFYSNERTTVKDLDSFTYTLPLELRVSEQLLRLQSDFFKN